MKEARYIDDPEYPEMATDWDALCDELAVKCGYRSQESKNKPAQPNTDMNSDRKEDVRNV